MADALERIDDALSFGCELQPVGDVLPGAAAALPEVGTGGLDAVGGGLHDLGEARPYEAAVILGDLDRRNIAGAPAGHESRASIREATDRLTTVC